MPNATGSCFRTIVMPIAASMPLITAEGTSAEKRPDFSTPNSSCSTPAIITAVRNGLHPSQVLHLDEHDGGQSGGRTRD